MSSIQELRIYLNHLISPKRHLCFQETNHSDALQMWLVKQLTGLSPESKYSIQTEVELASKYPDGSVGIGGSPGNSVHLVSKFATEGYTLEKGKAEGDNVQLVLKKSRKRSRISDEY